jgi:hypothetical protein
MNEIKCELLDWDLVFFSEALTLFQPGIFAATVLLFGFPD